MTNSSPDRYKPPTPEELLKRAKGRLEATVEAAGDMYVKPETVALVEKARDLDRARNADPREGASIVVINGEERFLAPSTPPSAVETAKAFSDAELALRLPQSDRK